MNEQLMAAAWQQVCDNVKSLRKSDGWRGSHADFNSYVKARWSLSKTRAKLYCDFSTFSAMCRAEHLHIPDSPDNVKPILELAQKHWIDTWILCIDKADGSLTLSHKHIKSVLDYYGIGIKRRVPASILKARKVRAAAKTMADIGDGEALVDEIGVTGLGHDWDLGVKVTIDADQAKMDKNDE